MLLEGNRLSPSQTLASALRVGKGSSVHVPVVPFLFELCCRKTHHTLASSCIRLGVKGKYPDRDAEGGEFNPHGPQTINTIDRGCQE